MAQHPSAKKRIRRNGRRALINRMRASRIRTCVRKVDIAITTGSKTQAKAAFEAAVPELMRGVNKGVIHCNKAARKMSRLAARIKSLVA
ncbi:SSU ribosomal protein S20p [invertebrate metagenome]|uniref:SSU ribosomal protein S20p n=1 Tax=invertebrate metagenome TaxID=1711999 RepID=A0A484H6K4_9ZZZZ